MRNWKRRYFVLDVNQHCFSYYVSNPEPLPVPKGRANILGYEVHTGTEVDAETGYHRSIKLTKNGARTWNFVVDTEEQLAAWINVFTRAVTDLPPGSPEAPQVTSTAAAAPVAVEPAKPGVLLTPVTPLPEFGDVVVSGTEEELVKGLLEARLIIAVRLLRGPEGRLVLRVIPVTAGLESASVIAVSYRWCDSANAVTAAAEWPSILLTLCQGHAVEVLPTAPTHRPFFLRLGRSLKPETDYWIDQFSIPQRQSFSMELVILYGSLYCGGRLVRVIPNDKFVELAAAITAWQAKEEEEQSRPPSEMEAVLKLIADANNDLAVQFGRGWILRETTSRAKLDNQDLYNTVSEHFSISHRIYEDFMETNLAEVARKANSATHSTCRVLLQMVGGRELAEVEMRKIHVRLAVAPFYNVADRDLLMKIDGLSHFTILNGGNHDRLALAVALIMRMSNIAGTFCQEHRFGKFTGIGSVQMSYLARELLQPRRDGIMAGIMHSGTWRGSTESLTDEMVFLSSAVMATRFGQDRPLMSTIPFTPEEKKEILDLSARYNKEPWGLFVMKTTYPEHKTQYDGDKKRAVYCNTIQGSVVFGTQTAIGDDVFAVAVVSKAALGNKSFRTKPLNDIFNLLQAQKDDWDIPDELEAGIFYRVNF